MKNKMFKKFGALLMALMLIITSISSLTNVKAAGFDPDNLYWEFPVRNETGKDFSGFNKPLNGEVESRLISTLKDGEYGFIIKIFNEQIGNRTIYLPVCVGSGDESLKITLFYGDKIEIKKVSADDCTRLPFEIYGDGLKLKMERRPTSSSAIHVVDVITNIKSKNLNLSFYCNNNLVYTKLLLPGATMDISTSNPFSNVRTVFTDDKNKSSFDFDGKIIIGTPSSFSFGDNIREATPYFPGEEELAKAKEDAKSEIDKLENLSEEDKNKAKTDIDNATDKTTVDKIVEDAKKKDADNKTAADEKTKEEELAKAKEEAKKEIDKLENLSEEDKNKAKTDIDNAPDTTTVDKIVEDAKKKDADNKTAADEKAKEEELAKAKEEAKKEINSNPNLTNADKDKYAKDIDNAKTVKEVRDILDEAKKKAEAKINENDPEYLKNKLKKLIEEAKRARYPSEELEEAIDEAYDILLDRYSRIEDYKYAIENLERILQNMRDTRRNRFKLDVDDLNEKDEELTGKTETKWYIDVYNGKKRILSGQANYKGDFVIEIKKGKIKAKDTLKVVATDPQNDKKYKEVEIEVGGDSKETKDNNPTFNINDLLQADGSKPLTDLAVFPVGKNFYNVVQNGQKTTVYMDVKTFISGNRTMLPIRYIAYTLGFNVEYDNFTREAIFSNTENSALAKKTIRVNIDTGLMKDSYGNVFASDVRPVLINNRIHASIANIARMFEASQGTIEDGINQTIEWDSARKAVYVFKNIK